MLGRLHSVALICIEALGCEVEVDCADHGFETAAVVGLRCAQFPEEILFG